MALNKYKFNTDYQKSKNHLINQNIDHYKFQCKKQKQSLPFHLEILPEKLIKIKKHINIKSFLVNLIKNIRI